MGAFIMGGLTCLQWAPNFAPYIFKVNFIDCFTVFAAASMAIDDIGRVMLSQELKCGTYPLTCSTPPPLPPDSEKRKSFGSCSILPIQSSITVSSSVHAGLEAHEKPTHLKAITRIKDLSCSRY